MDPMDPISNKESNLWNRKIKTMGYSYTLRFNESGQLNDWRNGKIVRFKTPDEARRVMDALIMGLNASAGALKAELYGRTA